MKMSTGARLRFLKEKLLKKISREKFVEGLGISARTLQSYEEDETSPGADFLQHLWNKYHDQLSWADFSWLLTGVRPSHAAEDGYAHIPLYDVRPAAGGGAFVQAEEVTDILAFRKEWIANELRASVKDLAVLFVEGDSMTPTLSPGDIIMVLKSESRALQDGIYVIWLEGTLLVKRLQKLLGGRVAVRSDNLNYPPLEVDIKKTPDFRVIGRVIWAGKRF